MALAHKALTVVTIPWRMAEKRERLPGTDSISVPVIVDGEKTIRDSWQIAEYLDDRPIPETHSSTHRKHTHTAIGFTTGPSGFFTRSSSRLSSRMSCAFCIPVDMDYFRSVQREILW